MKKSIRAGVAFLVAAIAIAAVLNGCSDDKKANTVPFVLSGAPS